jgi:hypothetical protein
MEQSLILGLKAKEFPKEMAAQNMQATAMVKDLINRVLGREEPFTLTVRKGSGTLRYARDSALLLLPPVEVPCHYFCQQKAELDKTDWR